MKAAKERPAPNFILVAGVRAILARRTSTHGENETRRMLNASEWQDLKRAFNELNWQRS